jgi:DNA-binding MarR family transcriptional regulator
VSKTLARLQSRSLVERVASPTDRRASLVTITQAGVAAVDVTLPRRLAVESAVLKGLEQAERPSVIEALATLERVLDAAMPG